MSDPNNKYNDTFVDDCGVEHHIDDFRPSEDEQLQPGQCICGLLSAVMNTRIGVADGRVSILNVNYYR